MRLFNVKKWFHNLIPNTHKREKVNDAKPPSHLSFIAKKEGGSKFLLRSKLSFGS